MKNFNILRKIEMRQCPKCSSDIIKGVYCTACRKEYNKNYRIKNKGIESRYRQRKHNYYLLRKNDPIMIANRKAANQKYLKGPKRKITANTYRRNKRKNDLNFKISVAIRNRIKMAMKRNSKFSASKNLIGCSFDFLKQYIQSKFKTSMSWDNYGTWHIDHILPCASFDLSKSEEQLKCFHYSNLQPLWAKDNLSKGAKITFTLSID